MKSFEERSPTYQRWANRFELYVLGSISMAAYGLFILAFVAMILMGIAATLRHVIGLP
jgi:hypothetical protein